MARNKIVPIPEGNAPKYFSYRENWGQIKRCIAVGSYGDAVLREESIFCDLLIAFLVKEGHLPADQETQRKGLSQLVKMWRKHHLEIIADGYFDDLHSAVDEWRERRNIVAHGAVKSLPGAAPLDPLRFRELAAQTAKDGERLAKSVRDWLQRVDRRRKRNAKNSQHRDD